MIFAVFALAGAASASLQTETEDLKIVASDAAFQDRFAQLALASSGDLIAAGAYNAGVGGQVYVYKTDDGGLTYAEQQILVPADIASNDDFGVDVALEGDHLLATARFADDGASSAGAAYFFRTTDGGASWVEGQKLTSSSPQVSGGFSIAALALPVAAVCARNEDGVTSSTGVVYTYRTTDGGISWSETGRLSSTDGASTDNFGVGMSMTTSVLLAPAYRHNSLTGAVYVFTSSDEINWVFAQKITTLGLAGDLFGVNTGIFGNFAIVGASGHSDSGAVYVFETSDGGASWAEVNKILPSDGAASDNFGEGSAITDGYIVVGASQDDDGGASTGSMYVYSTTDSWTTANEVVKITASDGTASSFLGLSVQFGPNLVLGSAYGAVSGGVSDAGAIYAYQLPLGAVGDPVLVDMAGHRFLAGQAANTKYRLVGFGRDEVHLGTGDTTGLKDGYFIETVTLAKQSCGEATVSVVKAGNLAVTVSGDACAIEALAAGDNGLVVGSIGNGEASLVIKAHAYDGYTFLNVKLLGVSTAFRAGCRGMLCDETHADDIVV